MVMMLMTLDHVRDYFHVSANTDNPLNLTTTSYFLFFTRWITHFCAPIFVFLSGISIYLQSLRKTKKELSIFLITRGVWLIILELIVVTFGWTFNPLYHHIILQVIWAIGISMFILGLLIYLPFNLIVAISIAIILFHNLLDFLETASNFKPTIWWSLLHQGGFSTYPLTKTTRVIIAYPFLPWLGLMMLGYGFGPLFSTNISSTRRNRIFYTIGVALLLFFIVLRYLKFYGDPTPWLIQKNKFLTILSFINVQKYPPSLLYICMTIGPALLLLALFEKINNKLTDIMKIYGRTALFFYILHIFLIHFFNMIVFFLRGNNMEEAYNPDLNFPFYFVIPGVGYNLGVVYAVWVVVLVLLFPLCKWYNNYKAAHKEKWWLSYL